MNDYAYKTIKLVDKIVAYVSDINAAGQCYFQQLKLFP